MKTRKVLASTAPLALSLILSGCGTFSIGEDTYKCADYRDGVQCKSAREVYRMTEHSRTPRDPDKYAQRKSNAEVTTINDRSRASARRRGRATEAEVTVQKVVREVKPGRYMELEGPTPIRTPAKVMRIWVDSYEDKDGDLHVPGLVYTEIQERTWNIGQRAPERANRVRSILSQPSQVAQSDQ